jgi:putative transposase
MEKDLSMGSVGDGFDTSMAESFFATIECELVDQHRFRNIGDARVEIMSFIHRYSHPLRPLADGTAGVRATPDRILGAPQTLARQPVVPESQKLAALSWGVH